MDDAQKILLSEKLKEAAASGRNVHVMAQEGKWIVYKDGAKRATARYATREGAINNAKKNNGARSDRNPDSAPQRRQRF